MTHLTLHLTLITGSSRGVGAALVEQLIVPGQQILGIARGHNAILQIQADAASVALSQWSADLAEPLAVAQRLREWRCGLGRCRGSAGQGRGVARPRRRRRREMSR